MQKSGTVHFSVDATSYCMYDVCQAYLTRSFTGYC